MGLWRVLKLIEILLLLLLELSFWTKLIFVWKIISLIIQILPLFEMRFNIDSLRLGSWLLTKLGLLFLKLFLKLRFIKALRLWLRFIKALRLRPIWLSLRLFLEINLFCLFILHFVLTMLHKIKELSHDKITQYFVLF